jgi:hypothetical protein
MKRVFSPPRRDIVQSISGVRNRRRRNGAIADGLQITLLLQNVEGTMPIEIRELVIRATVEGGTPRTTAAGSEAARARQAREQIVADCVEQVIEILDKRNRR